MESSSPCHKPLCCTYKAHPTFYKGCQTCTTISTCCLSSRSRDPQLIFNILIVTIRNITKGGLANVLLSNNCGATGRRRTVIKLQPLYPKLAPWSVLSADPGTRPSHSTFRFLFVSPLPSLAIYSCPEPCLELDVGPRQRSVDRLGRSSVLITHPKERQTQATD